MRRSRRYESSIHRRKRRKRTAIVVACAVLALVVAVAVASLFLRNRCYGRLDSYGGEALLETDAGRFTFALPAYDGEHLVTEINGNVPFFTAGELKTRAFKHFSTLDTLGRCRAAYGCLDRSLMPDEERGEIGMVRPSGWQTVRYDDLIEDKYLYNRCHLIAFMLSGENANEKNLITGTRYMNVEGMLPIEEKVAAYIRKTGNHVMYRVTPCYEGSELVARGVLMEARSVEDNGRGLTFNLFVHNVQPGVKIDYKTGKSKRAE